ncbi:hypothetical protein Dsin_032979 [Dipteronia sinensis]|uniref:Uncharacterized protein n=1 Tax=Dipteronia sinensis TaxID=43782 RepID=A0AAD9ZF17_9ROSI|nr:hypothetical protein Dsin_032979 [Dipteronia sinensis]
MHAKTSEPIGPIEVSEVMDGGGTNLSDIGLNLSGSWQQGHSATYNTRRVFKSSAKDLPAARWELRFKAAHTALPPHELHQRHVPGDREVPTAGRQTGGGRTRRSSPDSDLEAFSHNPAHGSFAPLAFQPSAMTNCANQRFLSY